MRESQKIDFSMVKISREKPRGNYTNKNTGSMRNKCNANSLINSKPIFS